MSSQTVLRYDAALEKLRQKTEANIRDGLNRYEFALNNKANRNAAFNSTVDYIVANTEQYRRGAATLAQQLLSKQEGVDFEIPSLENCRADVRRALERYRCHLEARDIDAFNKEAVSVAGDTVSTAANQQMINARTNGVRFARVPLHDAKVCNYCIALASRGFVYPSKAAAFKASHQRCRCRVLPETAALDVGYRQSLYEKLYKLDQLFTQSAEDKQARAIAQEQVIAEFEANLPTAEEIAAEIEEEIEKKK